MLTRKNSWDLGRRSLDMVSMRSIKIRTKEEGEIAGVGRRAYQPSSRPPMAKAKTYTRAIIMMQCLPDYCQIFV